MGVRFIGHYVFNLVNFISPSKIANQQEQGETRLCPLYQSAQK